MPCHILRKLSETGQRRFRPRDKGVRGPSLEFRGLSQPRKVSTVEMIHQGRLSTQNQFINDTFATKSRYVPRPEVCASHEITARRNSLPLKQQCHSCQEPFSGEKEGTRGFCSCPRMGNRGCVRESGRVKRGLSFSGQIETVCSAERVDVHENIKQTSNDRFGIQPIATDPIGVRQGEHRDRIRSVAFADSCFR